MSPDLVAPMVAFLAHEACPVNGEIYAAGAGRFARIFIASTPGYVHPTASRRSRTSPSTGTRSTTRPATTSRPTSPAGRPPSWRTCPQPDPDLPHSTWTSRSTKRNGTSSSSAATSPSARSPPVRPLAWEEARCPTDLLREMGALGLLGILVPEEWGGIGMSTIGFVAAMEQIGRADQSVAAAWQAHATIGSLPLYLFGNDAAAGALAPPAGGGTGARRIRAHRAGRRLRRPRHPHPGRTTRRRLADQRSQDVHLQCRHRHVLRGDAAGRAPSRSKAGSRVCQPGRREGHARVHHGPEDARHRLARARHPRAVPRRRLGPRRASPRRPEPGTGPVPADARGRAHLDRRPVAQPDPGGARPGH